jgi:hypothetical protein
LDFEINFFCNLEGLLCLRFGLLFFFRNNSFSFLSFSLFNLNSFYEILSLYYLFLELGLQVLELDLHLRNFLVGADKFIQTNFEAINASAKLGLLFFQHNSVHIEQFKI